MTVPGIQLIWKPYSCSILYLYIIVIWRSLLSCNFACSFSWADSLCKNCLETQTRDLDSRKHLLDFSPWLSLHDFFFSVVFAVLDIFGGISQYPLPQKKIMVSLSSLFSDCRKSKQHLLVDHCTHYEFMVDCCITHNLSSCETKAWKKFRPEQDSNTWPLWYWCSCRGHGFESCSGLNFFHALISQLLKLCVLVTVRINHKFISFSSVKIHDLSYIHSQCIHCYHLSICQFTDIWFLSEFLFTANPHPWPGVAIFLQNALIFFRLVTY